MCNEHHDHYCACFCKKICGVIKLITAGVVLGSIAGMVAMYFFDRDKWLQCRARKVLKGAEEFTRDMQSKISNNSN
ncbi:MAG: hypothetical protein ACI4PJ_03680 [Acutalibacteraceae bacterium]